MEGTRREWMSNHLPSSSFPPRSRHYLPQRVAFTYLYIHSPPFIAGIPRDRHRHGQRHDIRMRLSCNFVNKYTTAYRVQYTFTRVHPRIPNGHPREEKRTSDKSARIIVRVRLVASWTGKSPDTPTSSRRSSRGSRRECPCRCRCPCRSRGIPAYIQKLVLCAS